jgi:hypothetical protein
MRPLMVQSRSASIGYTVQLRFTPLMKKRLTHRALKMVERSLEYFPELHGKKITVGYTRTHLGSASIVYRRETVSRLIVRLKVRKLTYQTIGHELTHLVQGLAHGDRSRPKSVDEQKIPAGEKQCDIWTLARHALFCDDAPTYIKMPKIVREHWPEYADSMRQLCIAAIARRSIHRLYIQWLEAEAAKLITTRPRQKTTMAQLKLPFVAMNEEGGSLAET